MNSASSKAEQTEHLPTDCVFYNAKFCENGKTYCYLTDDDSLDVGDFVLALAGSNNHEAIAQIESIEYHPADEAPIPMDKIKRVICNACNFDF